MTAHPQTIDHLQEKYAAERKRGKFLKQKLASWRTEVGGRLPIINPFFDPAKAADMTEHDVIAMQFIFAYMRGYAAAKGVSYGAVLAEFGAFCESHPDSFWLADH